MYKMIGYPCYALDYHELFNSNIFKVDYTWKPKPYFNVISNHTLGDLYKTNAVSLGVDFSGVPSDVPSGSTDMGNVSYVVPSIHPCFNIGPPVVNHTKEFAAAAGSLRGHCERGQSGFNCGIALIL